MLSMAPVLLTSYEIQGCFWHTGEDGRSQSVPGGRKVPKGCFFFHSWKQCGPDVSHNLMGKVTFSNSVWHQQSQNPGECSSSALMGQNWKAHAPCISNPQPDKSAAVTEDVTVITVMKQRS